MKFTAFIMLAFCIHVSATTLAQKVTLSEHKAPLEKVINEIKRQTGYSFFYNQDWLQQSQPVDVQVKNAPLETVLKACFANQPFDYAIVNKTIVLKPKPIQQGQEASNVAQLQRFKGCGDRYHRHTPYRRDSDSDRFREISPLFGRKGSI
jgi:hypothetical protein